MEPLLTNSYLLICCIKGRFTGKLLAQVSSPQLRRACSETWKEPLQCFHVIVCLYKICKSTIICFISFEQPPQNIELYMREPYCFSHMLRKLTFHIFIFYISDLILPNPWIAGFQFCCCCCFKFLNCSISVPSDVCISFSCNSVALVSFDYTFSIQCYGPNFLFPNIFGVVYLTLWYVAREREQ